MSCILRAVQTPEDWATLHGIRRAILFDGLRNDIVYDENHPDDRIRSHTPYLLIVDGEAIGTCRLDRHDDIGILRLVAIEEALQGKGYGRALSDLIDMEAKRSGLTTLRVNSHRSAVGYYEKIGWRRHDWDGSEQTGIAANTVQMEKAL